MSVKKLWVGLFLLAVPAFAQDVTTVQAQEAWNGFRKSLIAKCGSAYVDTRPLGTFKRYGPFSYRPVVALPLTEGALWHGQAEIHGTGYRLYNKQDETWGPMVRVPAEEALLSAEIWNRDGKWSFVMDGVTYAANDPLLRADVCSGIEAAPVIDVDGEVMKARSVDKPVAAYPPLAKAARVQGTVKFAALIGTDGSVMEVQLGSGIPLLVMAAKNAVENWTFQPVWLNGKPVEVRTTLEVNFTLKQ